MTDLFIIADDLTGAIEAGVQLAKQDIPAKVMLNSDVDFRGLLENETSVLIFNTESRHIKPNEAAERVKHIVKKGRLAGVKRFYKKTDSTMRGNIGAELEALLHASAQQSLAFIPAHPRLKRFTRKGTHYIDDQLVHETDFGNDPLDPMKLSKIPEILHQQTRINIHSIDVSSKGPLSDGILVFDCQSEHDLIRIGDFLLKNGLHHVLAGSAAMVNLFPQLFQLKSLTVKLPKLHRPTLIVNGSLNKISLDQVRHAQSKGVKMISIAPELLSDNSFYTNRLFHSLLLHFKTAIQSGEDIILNSTTIDHLEAEKVKNNEYSTSKHFESIAKQIGLIVSAILEEIHITSLAVFGGDTISGIMQAMSVNYITPKLEILPGVALSLVTVKNSDLQLISKPGGYGDKEMILHLLDFINTSKL